MLNTENIIIKFSPHIFWDTDVKDIDLHTHKRFIIQRVIQYGMMEDWELLQSTYGLNTIKEEAVQFRTLDKVSLSFLCHIFKLQKTDFRCYIYQQLLPNYWNS